MYLTKPETCQWTLLASWGISASSLRNYFLSPLREGMGYPGFWKSRLQQPKSRTHFLQFPAFFQVLMSVGITGSPGAFLSQSMIYSTVKLKRCNDISRASLVAQRLQCLPAMWETWVRSLGQEDPLEKEMATHSSILAWRIPWTEEPGGLQSTGLQRVGHDWAI